MIDTAWVPPPVPNEVIPATDPPPFRSIFPVALMVMSLRASIEQAPDVDVMARVPVSTKMLPPVVESVETATNPAPEVIVTAGLGKNAVGAAVMRILPLAVETANAVLVDIMLMFGASRTMISSLPIIVAAEDIALMSWWIEIELSARRVKMVGLGLPIAPADVQAIGAEVSRRVIVPVPNPAVPVITASMVTSLQVRKSIRSVSLICAVMEPVKS